MGRLTEGHQNGLTAKIAKITMISFKEHGLFRRAESLVGRGPDENRSRANTCALPLGVIGELGGFVPSGRRAEGQQNRLTAKIAKIAKTGKTIGSDKTPFLAARSRLGHGPDKNRFPLKDLSSAPWRAWRPWRFDFTRARS